MDFVFNVLHNTRAFLETVITENSVQKLNKIPPQFNNNVIWNIGHIIVTQQLLVYKLSGLPILVDEQLVANYAKGTKPTKEVTAEEINVLKELLLSTVTQTEKEYKAGLFSNFKPYTVSTTGNTLTSVGDALQFNLYHEGLHFGVIKALLRV